MKTIRDSNGREWTIELNAGALARIRDLAGVDLLATGDDATWQRTCTRLWNDPVTIASVTAAACQPERQARDVDTDAFMALFDGQMCRAASDALFAELSFFFRQFQPAIAQELEDFLAGARTIEREAQAAIEKIRQDHPAEARARDLFQRAIKDKMTYGGTSTTSPPPSDSTGEKQRSDN